MNCDQDVVGCELSFLSHDNIHNDASLIGYSVPPALQRIEDIVDVSR